MPHAAGLRDCLGQSARMTVPLRCFIRKADRGSWKASKQFVLLASCPLASFSSCLIRLESIPCSQVLRQLWRINIERLQNCECDLSPHPSRLITSSIMSDYDRYGNYYPPPPGWPPQPSSQTPAQQMYSTRPNVSAQSYAPPLLSPPPSHTPTNAYSQYSEQQAYAQAQAQETQARIYEQQQAQAAYAHAQRQAYEERSRRASMSVPATYQSSGLAPAGRRMSVGAGVGYQNPTGPYTTSGPLLTSPRYGMDRYTGSYGSPRTDFRGGNTTLYEDPNASADTGARAETQHYTRPDPNSFNIARGPSSAIISEASSTVVPQPTRLRLEVETEWSELVKPKDFGDFVEIDPAFETATGQAQTSRPSYQTRVDDVAGRLRRMHIFTIYANENTALQIESGHWLKPCSTHGTDYVHLTEERVFKQSRNARTGEWGKIMGKISCRDVSATCRAARYLF